MDRLILNMEIQIMHSTADAQGRGHLITGYFHMPQI